LSDENKGERTINLSPHAKEKLKRLRQSGVTEEKVVKTVHDPEKLSPGFFGRKIAQSSLSGELMLRVVYEEMDNSILVVTMYPAKKGRYE
jgi:hypothetical protein